MMLKNKETMIAGRDFVIVNPQSWQTDVSGNIRNIALEIARHNRVLFCNPPLSRNVLHKQKNDPFVQEQTRLTQDNRVNSIREIHPNIWNLYPAAVAESAGWLPNTNAFNVVNKVNNKRFAQSIKDAMKQLNFQNIIVLNDTEMFKGFYLKELLRPDLYIYYSKDYMLEIPYWKKHGQILEPKLMQKVDIGIANSEYLRDLFRKHNSNAHYVGQGCNLDVFDVYKERSVPLDMAPIKKPIVGYVGAITTYRIDYRVIHELAKQMPDWSVVMIGQPADGFPVEELSKFPNVHFLGKKPLEQLPDYIMSFDVCINPQLLNPTTIGNYPLKIDEYLAMGKPVVATKTEGMKMFADYCELPATPEDYPAAVRKIYHEITPAITQARIDFARSHTWENCVHAIYQAIEQTYTNRTVAV
jgi:teichuronic acid biosynthesis glycosyltransferase TuaH